jgi:hypothetical protein
LQELGRWLPRYGSSAPFDFGTGTTRRRARLQFRPGPEYLEPRFALSSLLGAFVWDAKGDGMSWNDPNNWRHFGPQIGVPLTGTPTRGAAVVFPPFSALPAGSPKTINFNFPDFSFPINTLTIEDSYTFQGNPITVQNNVFVANPFGSVTSATIRVSGLTFDRGASVFTATGSTLSLVTPNTPNGLQINLVGGLTKSGSGRLEIDTQRVVDPTTGFSLQTLEIAGGTVAIGRSVDFSGTRFVVDSGANLVVDANVVLDVGSIAGAGVIDLQGTAAATDQTSLTANVPVGESARFTGLIEGLGKLIKNGNGSLETSAIDFSDSGSLEVLLGTFTGNGPISAGSLQVGAGATFGGTGPWHFSGPAVFQAGSTFAVSLDGLAPGTSYTQLRDSDATTGINLGFAALSATIGYQYQAGDTFTIDTGPLVQGQFQNVVGGFVLLGGNVPFSVTYGSSSVTLVAQQSETTTVLTGSPNPSHPGEPVSLTAAVSTRTAPVTTGTVRFEEGTTVLGTVPLSSTGTATFHAAGFPLGGTAITAVYSGASGILGSTSAAWTQSVVPYATTTNLVSSANPSLPSQSVTFTATVSAREVPVTTGAVNFTRGNQLLGTVALDALGTASLTISTLPVGSGRIQAAYNGSPTALPSLSPLVMQSVIRFTTTTSLALVTKVQANGRLRYVLEATVETAQSPGLAPTGIVVFRRGGKVIGRVHLTAGRASLTIGRHPPARGTYVAAFQGSSRFQPSTSARLKLPA